MILLAGVCGGVIGIFLQIKRRRDREANESLTQAITGSVEPRADPQQDSVPLATHKCPQCTHPYNLADYREDAEHIFCEACHAELPQR